MFCHNAMLYQILAQVGYVAAWTWGGLPHRLFNDCGERHLKRGTTKRYQIAIVEPPLGNYRLTINKHGGFRIQWLDKPALKGLPDLGMAWEDEVIFEYQIT
jgi:hypothetical protein